MLPQTDGTQLMIGRDATLEINIRAALAESRTRFKDLVDVAADFAWETDGQGQFCYISPRGALGYAPEELLGEAPNSFLVSPETAPNPLPFTTQRSVRNVEVWMRARGGEETCLLISAMPLKDRDGIVSGARGIALDVTEERRQQAELARLKIRERLVAYIVDSLRNEVTPTEMLNAAARALARSVSADACFLQVLGPGGALDHAVYGPLPERPLIDSVISEVTGQGGPVAGRIGHLLYLGIATGYRGEENGVIALWRAEGEADWDAEEIALLKTVEPQFGIVFRQILDQNTLEYLSRTDDLTGLKNRRAFMEDLSREMSRYERYGDGGALLFVDLDNFKPINDRFGHEKGDEALRAVGELLTKGTRKYDLVCRLGGDEFAVWIENADRGIAQARAESFLTGLERWKADVLKAQSDFGMSIGIAMFEPGKSESVEGLIARADAAMYEAKKSGKNRVVFAKGPGEDAS
jgi:diguanylate cyclase (GGDEF)-like protein/PAS domain S-box-containing protein